MLSLQSAQVTLSQESFVWLRDANTFSVNSMYRFLSLAPIPHSTIANIWKIKAPLRILIFSWLLLTNRLTTIDNLARRGWHLPNMCSMCKASEETVDHLFQKCIVAKEVREYIYTALPHCQSISHRFNTTQSTQLITDPTEDANAKHWELTTCFVLWRERCRRIFSDKELRWISIVREIQLERKSWFQDKVAGASCNPR